MVMVPDLLTEPFIKEVIEDVIQSKKAKAVRKAKLDPRQVHGSAYGMAGAKRGYQKAYGEWNEQEVTVKGSTIKVVLNGTKILDADLSKVKEFMGGKPHPGMHRKEGHFGFAGHSDPVSFRNIRIKRLQKETGQEK